MLPLGLFLDDGLLYNGVETCQDLDAFLALQVVQQLMTCADLFDGVMDGVDVRAYCGCFGSYNVQACNNGGLCQEDFPVLVDGGSFHGLYCHEWDALVRAAVDTTICNELEVGLLEECCVSAV